MRTRRQLIAVGLGGLLLAAASAAFAQFLPPPQAPPVLPPVYQGYPPVQQPQFGFRCATQYGICLMAQAGPVGMACYCPTAYGAVYGQIYP